MKSGGKGTQGSSGELAYRPGWYLGEIPYALQFNRKNEETGEKELFPAKFVWCEVEYAADVDYQQESDDRMWYNKHGKKLKKPMHSMGGLNHVPENGAYIYRTNPNPATDPWIITGAMKVTRILKPSEVDAMVTAAGRMPQVREAGAFTDADVEAITRELGLDPDDPDGPSPVDEPRRVRRRRGRRCRWCLGISLRWLGSRHSALITGGWGYQLPVGGRRPVGVRRADGRRTADNGL